MKYVKCVYDGGATIRLTIGKIYEVLKFSDNGYSPVIKIEDNTGDIVSYSMYNQDVTDPIKVNQLHHWFIDAIPEIREQKINSILS